MRQGIGISKGQALAEVIYLDRSLVEIPACTEPCDVETEIRAFHNALAQTAKDTQALYERALETLPEEDARVFLAHKDILEDTFSVEIPICEMIQQEAISAAQAIDRQFTELASVFEQMDDVYMQARSADLRDLRERLLRNLLGLPSANLLALPKNVIVAAKEITPSDTANMDLKHISGFLTESGSKTSHMAIISRTQGIPAISKLASEDLINLNGKTVWMDGSSGQIETKITEERRQSYKQFLAYASQQKTDNEQMRGKITATADGKTLHLFANIGSPDDLDAVLENDAEGIGLFRTEFLFMNADTIPSEETQEEAYRKVLHMLAPRPVIIRTLDIGGDKNAPALSLPQEENPFLGNRAIRLCLDRPELFCTQLRALLRASTAGNLQIMFPMITSLDELLQAKALLDDVKTELLSKHIAVAEHIPVGMMIEVPAAALIADTFAEYVDFFSIGTNDLTQYTLAADRGNTKVTHLYNTAHPAVLKLIQHTIQAAHRHGIPCGICGEAGSDPILQKQFVRWHIDELSMTPNEILASRKRISEITVETD